MYITHHTHPVQRPRTSLITPILSNAHVHHSSRPSCPTPTYITHHAHPVQRPRTSLITPILSNAHVHHSSRPSCPTPMYTTHHAHPVQRPCTSLITPILSNAHVHHSSRPSCPTPTYITHHAHPVQRSRTSLITPSPVQRPRTSLITPILSNAHVHHSSRPSCPTPMYITHHAHPVQRPCTSLITPILFVYFQPDIMVCIEYRSSVRPHPDPQPPITPILSDTPCYSIFNLILWCLWRADRSTPPISPAAHHAHMSNSIVIVFSAWYYGVSGGRTVRPHQDVVAVRSQHGARHTKSRQVLQKVTWWVRWSLFARSSLGSVHTGGSYSTAPTA